MMELDYTTLVTSALTLIGGGWLFNVYSARPRKTSLEIENMKSVIDTMKESSRLYRENTDRTIARLNAKIETLEMMSKEKDDAIYAAYDCPFPSKSSDCVVLRIFRQCSKCSVETNIETDDDNKTTDFGDNA